MRRIIAIDTAGPVLGLCAVTDEGTVEVMEDHGPMRHVERLVPAMDEMLARLGWTDIALNGVAVAGGPGSFTGLRVGMAAAKALAAAHNAPLFSVDTLEALAATESALEEDAAAFDGDGTAHLRPPDTIVSVLDARKQRYYTAAFRREAGQIQRLTDDADLTKDAFAALVQRVGGKTWCAPGPLASFMAERFAAMGAVPARATNGCAVRGVASLALARLRAAVGADIGEGPYHGPFYLRSGDIGVRKAMPRFQPVDGSTAP